MAKTLTARQKEIIAIAAKRAQGITPQIEDKGFFLREYTEAMTSEDPTDIACMYFVVADGLQMHEMAEELTGLTESGAYEILQD